MTTSQRVPRHALLRRAGPWVVLAAILTGCASPAARTALTTLEDACDRRQAASTATCDTLVLVLEGGTTASDGRATAPVAIATTGRATDAGTTGATKASTATGQGSASTRPKAQAKPKSQAKPRSATKPRPVTRRVPKVRMPAITSAYFGGGVTVARFRITGDTRKEILRSITRNGPRGGAQGVTQPYLKYRFTFKFDRKGRCRIVRTGSTAVTMSFRVSLPTWAATAGTERTTATWWADELQETAAHERTHVRLWRNAVRQANRAVASGTCNNVGRRLEVIWQRASVANCRFDAAEYGVSMRACLRR